MRYRVGIIGGGLSGTLMAMKLLEGFRGHLDITIFERKPAQIFRGVAYASALKLQPLNVRAAHMNLWQDKPGDFYAWIERNWQKYFDDKPAADDFIRRDVFGDYVQDTFQRMILNALRHRSLDVVFEDVQHLHREGNQYVIDTHDGRKVFNLVILALGNFLPGDLPLPDPTFYQTSFYQSNPWDIQWMQALPTLAPVMFLGSGLTTVDQVINLIHQGHEGKIYIVSRRGFLPRAHQPYTSHAIPPLSIYPGITALEILQQVRACIQQGASQGLDWRNVIDHVRTQAPALWAAMAVDERRCFLRHVRPYWEVHRHRIPTSSLNLIEEKMAAGQIEVLGGRVSAMAVQDGMAHVMLRLRGTQEYRTIQIQRVVNCTGPQTDFRKIDQPLIRDMMNKGWLKTDELNLGLAVNDAGQLLDQHGQTLSNIFTIGSLRKGAMWECTALREITLQADQIVHKLKAGISSLEG